MEPDDARRRRLRWIAAAVLAVAALVIWTIGNALARGTTVGFGADAYGYVSQADLWAEGALRQPQPWVEQVPWPKPSILHRARRAVHGGGAHDDRIIRARLAQAFGRLIRSAGDRGHFVVLSPAFPSRLLTAFPPGTPVIRLTLEEALQRLSAGVSATVGAPVHEEEPE